MTFERELCEAKRIAISCGDILMRYYEPNIKFKQKKDGSVVSIGDKKSNEFALRELQGEFPLDSIVSEEDEPIIKNTTRCWYVDPLDGSSGYVRFNGQFAVHIGLAVEGYPVLGIVYKPLDELLYFGVQGTGSYMESKAGIFDIHTSFPEGLILACHSKLSITEIGKIFIARMKITDLESTGSEGLRIMKLATGMAHIYVGNVSLKASSWDVCAPDAICRAAGATIRYIDGSEIIYSQTSRMKTKYIVSFDKNLLNYAQRLIESLEFGITGTPWV